MKILFLTENFPPESNAAATRVYERACYWARWGHDVTVITCAPNFPEGRLFDGYANRWRQVEEMDGIRVVRVKTYISANRGVARRTLDFLSFMATGFWAGLFEARPDVVAATSPQFFAAVAGWMVGAARRRPFVFELGDLWPASIAAVGAMKPSLGLRLMEKVELFLYRRSACVVALTRAFKRNLTGRGIDPGKVAVVLNGVDLSRYAPRERDGDLARDWGLEGKFVVGYVGTHGMAHALANVLDAAERLRDADGLRVLLVGAGAEREALVAERERRGLANVVMQPRQPKEMMPRIWSLCDVALVHLKDSPVFAGVIPSKIFEAMGMGKPVLLAAPEGEASRIVGDDGAGLCVPAEDPAALAGAMATLMADADLRAALAARSLAAAPGHSREHQAREMLAALELAAAGRGGEAGGIGP
ncbi:MAG: glycosyltransferase family 4 protein [Hyphomicrobiales bacterium]|nr:glycosyltransferase family 4 protein [Hyphomicrobiales bacterium]MCP5370510.1 glycosyltransferase family 4 protein [Hyphomicrobiales bacterium]